jgi:phosphonate transport system ATP-binding protein
LDELRILEVRDLHFSYDGLKPILRGVNLALERGEALALMGTSGAGKTTLLKIVAGLLYPYEGVVKLSSDRVGYIPQHFGLVKNLTALQNVLLGSLGRVGKTSSLLGRFPRHEVERAYGLLEAVGLAHLSERKTALLSGGERQRVAVARALMQSPSILLADEFVADLDVANAIDIMRLTIDVCKRSDIAVLMTMHDAFLVNRFADRVAVLKEGRIAAEMDAKTVDVDRLEAVLR